MPSVSDILTRAPIAAVLASNDVDKGALYGKRLDPNLPYKIYATYYVIKSVYDADPTYPGLYANSQYLWEIMGMYGILAMGYTGGGGVIVGPGGTSTSTSTKFTFEISILVDASGGPVSGTSTYTPVDPVGSLINAIDLNYIIISNTIYSIKAGDFTFDSVFGTIDISPLVFSTGSNVIIPFAKYINTAASAVNDPIYFNNVSSYRLYWTAELIAIYGSGGEFSVEILGDDGKYRVTDVEIMPDTLPDTTYYDFNFNILSTGRIIFN